MTPAQVYAAVQNIAREPRYCVSCDVHTVNVTREEHARTFAHAAATAAR